ATFAAMGVGGALGAYAGGALADRWGRTTLTMAAMALSGLCAALIGLSFGGPPALTFWLAVLWGVTVIADSAQFSTAVTELSPPAYVGTALTAQPCVGFALTMRSIWLIPRRQRVQRGRRRLRLQAQPRLAARPDSIGQAAHHGLCQHHSGHVGLLQHPPSRRDARCPRQRDRQLHRLRPRLRGRRRSRLLRA